MLTLQTYLFSQLNANWFSPAEASLKRTLIQRLIYDILKSRSPEVSSAACSDEDEPSEFPVKNKNETCVEFLSKRCNPSIVYDGNKSSCQAGPGIEMTLLSASSMSSQCANNSGMVLTEFLESGATAGSLLGQYPSCDHQSSYYHLSGAISTSEVLWESFLSLYVALSCLCMCMSSVLSLETAVPAENMNTDLGNALGIISLSLYASFWVVWTHVMKLIINTHVSPCLFDLIETTF